VTSVQLSGTGITISQLSPVGSGQLNASFQASSTASRGVQNVTVTSASGTSAISAADQVFITSVTLTSFSFTNSVPYNSDCAGAFSPITMPTWSSAPTNGVACPESGNNGDHAVYVAGNTTAGTATFSVNPASPAAVAGVYVQGTTGSFGTFTAPSGSGNHTGW
jgi:hypothetical protein